MPEFNVEDLKSEVIQLLVTEHEMLLDDAEEAVNASMSSKPSFWNDRVDAKELANSLADDDDDE